MRRSVAIVAEGGDLHADAMTATLRSRHGIDPVLIDTRAFPRYSGGYALGTEGIARTLDGTSLDDVGAVWWRRAPAAGVPPSASRSDDEFRQAECDAFIQGIVWSLPAMKVNDPGAERVAGRKLVQLRAARAAGLSVPETLVTNDPAAARAFVESRGGKVIYKRTGTSAGEFCETKLFGPRDLDRLPSIRTAPTTFQDYVEAQADVRIVWAGGRMWAVRIDSQAGAGWLDSRLDNSVPFSEFVVPPPEARAVDALMESLGLAFGVLDLRLGRDGELHFLEVNPQGQFAYLEIKTGMPIFVGLAEVLAEPEPSRPVADMTVGMSVR